MTELEKVTFGAGCFWCVEAVFQRLKGVYSVVSGYAGGQTTHPTYKEVCSGKTGHAEVAQISFDPNVISFEELLEVFWPTHCFGAFYFTFCISDFFGNFFRCFFFPGASPSLMFS